MRRASYTPTWNRRRPRPGRTSSTEIKRLMRLTAWRRTSRLRHHRKNSDIFRHGIGDQRALVEFQPGYELPRSLRSKFDCEHTRSSRGLPSSAASALRRQSTMLRSWTPPQPEPSRPPRETSLRQAGRHLATSDVQPLRQCCNYQWCLAPPRHSARPETILPCPRPGWNTVATLRRLRSWRHVGSR